MVVLVAGLGVAPNAAAQAPPAGALQSHVGAYRFPSGGLLLVGYESDDAMRIRDLEAGTRATLQRIAPERYERDDVRLSFEARQSEAVAVAILLNGAYNPLPALLELRVPVLAMWGEHDLNVDPEINRAIFEVGLGTAGNRDYSLLIVPSADHELEHATSPRHALEDAPFAEGVWETMSNWVREKVLVR